MSEIEEGPLATIRLACFLYPFKYQFVCGEMQVISKKKQEMVPTVLSPLVKHFVRESLKVGIESSLTIIIVYITIIIDHHHCIH